MAKSNEMRLIFFRKAASKKTVRLVPFYLMSLSKARCAKYSYSEYIILRGLIDNVMSKFFGIPVYQNATKILLHRFSKTESHFV